MPQVLLLPSAFCVCVPAHMQTRTHAHKHVHTHTHTCTPVLRAQQSCWLYSDELMRPHIGVPGFQLVHCCFSFFSDWVWACVCVGGISHVPLCFSGLSEVGVGFILRFGGFSGGSLASSTPPVNFRWSTSCHFFLRRPGAREPCCPPPELTLAGKHIWSEEPQTGSGACPWASWLLARVPGPTGCQGFGQSVFIFRLGDQRLAAFLLPNSPLNLQPLCWT